MYGIHDESKNRNYMVEESESILKKVPQLETVDGTPLISQLLTLLWQKTNNLEEIQRSYEEEVIDLRKQIIDNEDDVERLRTQISHLRAELKLCRYKNSDLNSVKKVDDDGEGAKESPGSASSMRKAPTLSLLKKESTLEGTLAMSLENSTMKSLSSENVIKVTSDASEENIPSPGLSTSLQDALGHLDFLNDKNAIKISSVSSHSIDDDKLDWNVDDVFHYPNISYDTSMYNGESVRSSAGSSAYEDAFESTLTTSLLSPLTPDNIVTSTPIDKTSNSNVLNEKTNSVGEAQNNSSAANTPIIRAYITESEIPKHCVHVNRPASNELSSVSLPAKVSAPQGSEVISKSRKVSHEKHQNLKKVRSATFLTRNYTRSDTFDVITVPAANHNSDSFSEDKDGNPSPPPPPKPKRRVQRPSSWCKNESTEPSSEYSKSTYSFSSNRSSSFDYEVQYITPQLSDDDDPNLLYVNGNLKPVKAANSWQSEPTPVNSPPPTETHSVLSFSAAIEPDDVSSHYNSCNEDNISGRVFI